MTYSNTDSEAHSRERNRYVVSGEQQTEKLGRYAIELMNFNLIENQF